jgi:hypothetical protein
MKQFANQTGIPSIPCNYKARMSYYAGPREVSGPRENIEAIARHKIDTEGRLAVARRYE